MYAPLLKCTVTLKLTSTCMQFIKEKLVTAFAAEQYGENFRAGLLASKLNGLAAKMGDMAPERVVISIEKYRSVVATAWLNTAARSTQQQRRPGLSDRTCVQPCGNPRPKIEAGRVVGQPAELWVIQLTDCALK